MEIEGEVCSFCLENCENFKATTGNIENILDTLLLKINLTVITELLICKNCEEMIIKYFEFKTACLSTQNCIVPFLSNTDDVKLNLKDIYLSRNVADIGVPEDQDICGFCMGIVNNCSTISLYGEERDLMLEKMIEDCVPELDLSIIKDPVICASCHGSLEDYFRFVNVMNCLIMGEETKKHCETPNISSKGQIEFSCSLPPTVKDETTREVDGNWSNIIKVKEEFCEKEKYPDGKCSDVGSTVKLEEFFVHDIEGANKDVKNQSELFMELNDQQVNNEQWVSKNMSAPEEESNKIVSIKIEEAFCAENEVKCKEENLFEEDQQFLLNKEIDIKIEENDLNRLNHGIVSPQKKEKCSVQNLERAQQVSEITMYKCDFCLYQTTFKSSLNTHLMLHKNPSEVIIYKCDTCLYQTIYKSAFNTHLMLHKNPSEVTLYKCDTCLYQTIYKSTLKRHLLVHKDSSEVIFYKCDYCLYQTKNKDKQAKHLLRHKDRSEVHTCDFCPYQTKNIFALKGHLLVHKDPSEVTMYKCNSCSFQTKYKNSLKSHYLTHKDPSEVTVYTCDSCSFQTKRKHTLKEHFLIHKDPSEVVMHKCDHCPYQNKHKYVLKKHLMVHKDLSEITLYRCSSCSFQTKRKDGFKEHGLTHKDPSEVVMYKCDYCPYQNKRKYALKKHLAVHKDPSEITLYKCDYCSYQTMRKVDHKRHLLTHKNPSEITMYKCDSCSFQTKHKYNLKKHTVVHKDPSEITMYKCEYCSFQTKRRSRLMCHKLTHKKSQ